MQQIGCIAPVISESELEFIKAASECAATRGSHVNTFIEKSFNNSVSYRRIGIFHRL